MYCSNCGAQIPDGSHFCSKCGAPANGVDAQLAQNEPTEPVAQVPAQPTEPIAQADSFPKTTAVPAEPQAPAQPTEPVAQVPAQPTEPLQAAAYAPQQPQDFSAQSEVPTAPQPQKKPRTGLIVAIIAVVVVALVVGIIFLVRGLTNDDTPSSSGGTTTTTTNTTTSTASTSAEGAWELTSAKTGGQEVTIDPSSSSPMIYMQMVFNKDGSGTVFVYSDGENVSGDLTYKQSGNTVTLLDVDGMSLTSSGSDDYSGTLSGDTLTIAAQGDSGSSTTMVFTRTDTDTAKAHRDALAKKSTSSGGDSTTSGSKSSVTNSDLAGSWKMSSISYAGTVYTVDEYKSMAGSDAETIAMTFKEDGTGTLTVSDSSGTDSAGFNYALSGNAITITDETGTTSADSFDLTYNTSTKQIDLTEGTDSGDVVISFSKS